MKVGKNVHILPVNAAAPARVNLLKWVVRKISALFQPEEVEVEFNKDGDYTYTVIHHKKVA
jgi:hypothetical protein